MNNRHLELQEERKAFCIERKLANRFIAKTCKKVAPDVAILLRKDASRDSKHYKKIERELEKLK